MYDSCVVAGQLHNMLSDLKRWWCMKANSIVVFHWVLNCGDYNVSVVCEQTGCLLCLGSGWLKCLILLGAEELLSPPALWLFLASCICRSHHGSWGWGESTLCCIYRVTEPEKTHPVLRSHHHLMLCWFGATSFRAFIASFYLCTKWNNFGKIII